MRTSNGVRYPNYVAMAFNPVMFVAETEGVLALEVTMANGDGDSMEVRHDAFADGCYIDMSDYAKGLFGGVEMPSDYASISLSAMMKELTYQVRLRTSSGWSVALAQDAGVSAFIWGALSKGETIGCNRHYKRVDGAPFVVDCYNGGGDTFDFVANGQTVSVTPPGGGLYHVPIPSALQDAEVVEVHDSWGVAVIRKDCENGVALRWIDRHGMIAHGAFKRGAEATETAKSGEYRRNNLLNWEEGYGWTGDAGDGCIHDRKDRMNVCAVDVTLEECRALMDLASSPLVEMWDGFEWIKVRVKEDDWMVKNVSLQDLEFELWNDVMVQRG